jgi:hypothetical protein
MLVPGYTTMDVRSNNLRFPNTFTGRNANSMATQTQTQRSAAGKKAAATRKRNTARRSASSTRSLTQSAASSAASTTSTRAQAEVKGIEALALQAERAVLIPVGAALIARDNVLENVKPFTSRTTAEREINKLQRRVATNLRKFERRGTTARNKFQRDVKRNRTQVERFVRTNRRSLESQVRSARKDFERGANEFVSNVAANLP